MSHQDEECKRRARSYLFDTPKARRAVPISSDTIDDVHLTGWRAHGSQMRFSAYTPLPLPVVDAMENELQALGLKPQGSSPDATVPHGYYSIGSDAITFDGKHLDGVNITVAANTFANTIQPALEQWRGRA